MKKAGWMISLIALLVILAGCGSPSEETDVKKVETAENVMTFSEFDEEFMDFMAERSTGNYMVSPLSFRYALGLLLSGSSGKTEQELMKALGIGSEEEWGEYCRAFRDFADAFEDAESDDRALRVCDSIWKRKDISADFSKEYRKKIEESYGAEYLDFTPENAVKKINGWVKEKTEEMIPEFLPKNYDTENLAVVLINALYFKDAWCTPFMKESTREGTFHAAGGKDVKKYFMMQEDQVPYYEDEDTKLVILPMKGDVSMAFVIGDTKGLSGKLSKAQSEKVRLKIPKFDFETELCGQELKDFLKERGAEAVFDPEKAEFAEMMEYPVHVNDILQKTKIGMDEGGVEAAAVTGMMMVGTAASEDEPKKFTADQPFTFYIYAACNEKTEIMFAGRVEE